MGLPIDRTQKSENEQTTRNAAPSPPLPPAAEAQIDQHLCCRHHALDSPILPAIVPPFPLPLHLSRAARDPTRDFGFRPEHSAAQGYFAPIPVTMKQRKKKKGAGHKIETDTKHNKTKQNKNGCVPRWKRTERSSYTQCSTVNPRPYRFVHGCSTSQNRERVKLKEDATMFSKDLMIESFKRNYCET